MDSTTQVLKIPTSFGLGATSILLLAALIVVASRLLAIEHDPREPPVIKPSIPVIGHLIGIYRHGAQYLATINIPYKYPIYTLPTPGMKQYIVTSPHVAAQLQRSHKDLSFYNAIIEVTRRMTGIPKSAIHKLEYNMDGHLGRDKGLMPVMHDMLDKVLGRGSTLESITQIQLTKFTEMLTAVPDDQVVNLNEWLQDTFAEANIHTLYGPDSPIAHDKTLIKSFWDFEQGMLGLTVDILPSITMSRAYRGRERVVAALIAYVRRDAHKSASPVIQNRVRINMEHEFDIEEAGRSELVVWFAILGNAVPSTFWCIMDLFTRPALLAEVRAELQKAVTTSGNGKTRTINVSTIKSQCPLFVSCYRETLRLIGNLASIRYVLRDTVIGKHFLRGNSLIQVPSAIIHEDSAIWGEDAAEFNPSRFVAQSTNRDQSTEVAEDDPNKPTTATSLPAGVPSAAYRLFGGGSVICPGRHFAQSEILGFVAYMVLGFELTDPNGGVPVAPPKNKDGMTLTLLKPVGDVRVRMRRREKGVRWVVEL